jgi:hypothetical protein
MTDEGEAVDRRELLCHLGTIAHQTRRKLRIDPNTARIIGDAETSKLSSRSCEAGWAPSV